MLAMSFFEAPAPGEGVLARAVVVSPPAWAGPPDNVLPGVVPAELIVARTDRTVVAVTGLRAYPTGIGFTLSVRLRDLSDRERWRFASLFGYGIPEGEPPPDELLRFGVQFPNGAKATNLDRRPFPDDGEPDGPVLLEQGSSGYGTHAWDADEWLWPLPPPGPLAFVCEWPGRGLGLSRAEIDGERIREAAGRAVTLWPEGPGSPAA
jgi:hypothetical protein